MTWLALELGTAIVEGVVRGLRELGVHLSLVAATIALGSGPGSLTSVLLTLDLLEAAVPATSLSTLSCAWRSLVELFARLSPSELLSLPARALTLAVAALALPFSLVGARLKSVTLAVHFKDMVNREKN